MPENFYMYFVAALIPFLIGGVWYGPLFGKSWMKINGFTDEYLQKGNMAVIYGSAYLLCIIYAFSLGNFAIHQSSIYGLFMPEVMESGSQIQEDVRALFAKYGDRHRNFGHGAVHGVIFGLFIALPIIGVNALFERRGWKYTLLHVGYWVLSSALVGGLLCATLKYGTL